MKSLTQTFQSAAFYITKKCYVIGGTLDEGWEKSRRVGDSKEPSLTSRLLERRALMRTSAFSPRFERGGARRLRAIARYTRRGSWKTNEAARPDYFPPTFPYYASRVLALGRFQRAAICAISRRRRCHRTPSREIQSRYVSPPPSFRAHCVHVSGRVNAWSRA